MIDSNQESPAETNSSREEETILPTVPDTAGDHSSEANEFQGQPIDTLESRILRRVGAIEEMLKTKEKLILEYVNNRVPIPFYLNWKRELNDLFSLRVRLKRRSEGLVKGADMKKGA